MGAKGHIKVAQTRKFSHHPLCSHTSALSYPTATMSHSSSSPRPTSNPVIVFAAMRPLLEAASHLFEGPLTPDVPHITASIVAACRDTSAFQSLSTNEQGNIVQAISRYITVSNPPCVCYDLLTAWIGSSGPIALVSRHLACCLLHRCGTYAHSSSSTYHGGWRSMGVSPWSILPTP